MGNNEYEQPSASIIMLHEENVICGSPEAGQTEKIGYEDLFS